MPSSKNTMFGSLYGTIKELPGEYKKAVAEKPILYRWWTSANREASANFLKDFADKLEENYKNNNEKHNEKYKKYERTFAFALRGAALIEVQLIRQLFSDNPNQNGSALAKKLLSNNILGIPDTDNRSIDSLQKYQQYVQEYKAVLEGKSAYIPNHIFSEDERNALSGKLQTINEVDAYLTQKIQAKQESAQSNTEASPAAALVP